MEMTPDNWNRVKAVFEAALTLEPSERAAFLERSCPEVELRKQVERLQLAPEEFQVSLPRWSPDGKRIAFIGRKHGDSWKIYVVSAFNRPIH